jgi:glutamate synthase (NADPH/NADH) large chain
MTGGTVVILGSVGDNFGAGFTGGVAFVYDESGEFEQRINPDTLTWQRIASAHWEGVLRQLLEQHVDETKSRYAATLLHDWPLPLAHFWQVVPKDYVRYLPQPLSDQPEALRA